MNNLIKFEKTKTENQPGFRVLGWVVRGYPLFDDKILMN